MSDQFPRIVHRPPTKADHLRMAALYEAAARSFTNQLSTVKEPERRGILSRKIERQLTNAKYHRDQANEADDT